MQYFWGIVSILLRSLTKNKKKLIPSGRIPKISMNFLGITFQDYFWEVSGQFPGIKGIITITKLPPTTFNIESNLWVGCKIKGLLLSPNKFVATSLEECFSALKKQNGDNAEVKRYITFLRQNIRNDETLAFENCFAFKKETFPMHRSFGSSLSGLVINLRH